MNFHSVLLAFHATVAAAWVVPPVHASAGAASAARPRVAPPPSLLLRPGDEGAIWATLHHLEGAVGAVALAFVGKQLWRGDAGGGGSGEGEGDAIRERIRKASQTTALTYEVAHPDEYPRLEPSRRQALERAQSMLNDASRDVEKVLEEAERLDDDETARECRQLLNKMRPLPDDVALASRESVDYKRWLDPNSLR